MAGLAAEFRLRYTTQRIVELSNPGDPDPTTENTTLTDQVVLDATAAFLTYAEKVIDTDVVADVLVGISFMFAFFMAYESGTAVEATKEWKRAVDAAVSRKNVTSRARIPWTTDSQKDPTEDRRANDVRDPKPSADDTHFDGLTPSRLGTDGAE